VFCATVLRVAPTGSYPAHCPAEFGLSSRRSSRPEGPRANAGDRLARCDRRLFYLTVALLRNLVLLKLLVQITAGRVDRFGRLGDVPAVFPELADEKRTLGVVLELAQRADPGLVRRRAPGVAVGSRRSRHTHRPGHLDGLRQIRGVDDVACGHDDQTLDRVTQLADVALPSIPLQHLPRPRRPPLLPPVA